MVIDKSAIAEVWLKNFPEEWNGIYLAISIVYPAASESWKLYYSNELQYDDEFKNLKLQFKHGTKKASLLPTEDEFKLYLWDRARREPEGRDRLKAAFLYAQVAGMIKKDTGTQGATITNVMVLPQSPPTVDAWEQQAIASQDTLRNVKVIDHEPSE